MSVLENSNVVSNDNGLRYDDLKYATETIDKEIATLEILKNNLD